MSDEAAADVENYQGNKEELSFRSLVLEQYRRVLRLGSVEFHGGFWMETVDRTGKEKLSYIPATHEAFSNGVNMLAASVHAHFDTDMKSAWNAAVKAATDGKNATKEKLRANDEVFNNGVMNTWHHERASTQYILFIGLCDFLKRKGYLSDDSEVDK